MGKTFRRQANPDYIDGARQIRRSGAAGPHQDTRSRRSRTRSRAEDHAIEDSLKNDVDEAEADYWSAIEDPSEHL